MEKPIMNSEGKVVVYRCGDRYLRLSLGDYRETQRCQPDWILGIDTEMESVSLDMISPRTLRAMASTLKSFADLIEATD